MRRKVPLIALIVALLLVSFLPTGAAASLGTAGELSQSFAHGLIELTDIHASEARILSEAELERYAQAEYSNTIDVAMEPRVNLDKPIALEVQPLPPAAKEGVLDADSAALSQEQGIAGSETDGAPDDADQLPSAAPEGISPESVKEEAIARAIDPGLRLTSFYVTGHSEPLPCNQYLMYQFTLENTSYSATSYVYMYIYVDGAFIGQMNIGSLPGNITASGTIELAMGDPGYHTIRIELSNGSALERRYLFGSTGNGADFAVTAMQRSPSGSITAPQNIVFSVDIANYGPVGSYYDHTFTIEGLGEVMLSHTNPYGTPYYLPASTMQTLTFTVTDYAGTSGTYFNVYSRVTGRVSDPNSSNNSSWFNYYCNSNPHFAGKWSNASNLVIGVDPYLTNYTSFSNAEAAATAWNGITNNVRLQVEPYEYVSSSCQMTLADTNFSSTGLVGQTYLFNSYGQILYLYEDASAFTRAEIYIDRNMMMTNTAATITTITHEVGHALGLGHLHEGGSSVMIPRYTGGETISSRDQSNLRSKYS